MASIETGNWDALWSEIMLFVGRNVLTQVQDKCLSELQGAGWDIAKSVMERLREEPRISTNLYGSVTTAIKLEQRARYAQTASRSDAAQDKSPYNTRPIAVLIGKVLEELHACRAAGRMQMQVSAVGKPYPNIQEWHAAGRQPTWSDLHDRFLIGYHTAWLKEQAGDLTSVIDYMQKSVTALKAIRMRRDVPSKKTADAVPQALELPW